jgi:hypothetical protein
MALTDNLVSYYKLDESSGNAVDSVGSNTLTNTGTATYSAGKINNGVNLVSASSQYLIDTTPSGLPTSTSAFSVSLWLKATSWTGDSILFSWGTNPGTNQIVIRSNSSTTFGVGDTSTFKDFTVSTMSTGTWYHLVVTCAGSGSGISLYFNGSLISTSSTLTYSITNGYLQLGGAYLGAFSLWNGSEDEVGIWSRALTSGEVTQLYNGGAGNQYPFTSSNNSGFFNLM